MNNISDIELIIESPALITLLDIFDNDWYLDNNPDVAEKEINPLKHYLMYGAKEGRNPNPLFYSSWYLEQYLDTINAEINPLLHYLQQGASEGCNPNPLFHSSWYLEQYPKLAAKGINPLAHYLQHGTTEGCNPNPLFDTTWYLKQNPDVAAAGVNPLIHYLLNGGFEKRDPGPDFNTRYYLAKHPRVASLDINPLIHYYTTEEDAHSCSLPDFIYEQLDEAAIIEPLLRKSREMLPNMAVVFHPTKHPSLEALKEIEKILPKTIDQIILTSDLQLNHLTHLINSDSLPLNSSEDSNKTVVISTDDNELPKCISPDFFSISLSNLVTKLSSADKEQLIIFIIQNYRPISVFNVSSMVAWRLFEKYGKPLSSLTRLCAILSDKNEKSEESSIINEFIYFRTCIQYISETYVLVPSTRDRLIKLCGLSETYARTIKLINDL